MNLVALDPNIKINMSLDEIILLTRGHINYHLRGKHQRNLKKKRSPKRRTDLDVFDHSVPLLSSTEGADIFVCKKSPLLSAENRRRIARAVSNRVLNSNLLEESKEIIPAKCRLVKIDTGIEKIIVPAVGYSLKPPQRKLSPPRKLNKTIDKLKQDEPPPLIVAPIYSTFEHPVQNIPMEVDNPDDEIKVNSPNSQKMMEVIDFEPNWPQDTTDTLNAKVLCTRVLNSMPRTTLTTLNDRFTMLSENFKF